MASSYAWWLTPAIPSFKRWGWQFKTCLDYIVRSGHKTDRTKQSKASQDRTVSTWQAEARDSQVWGLCSPDRYSISPRQSWPSDKTLSGEEHWGHNAPLICYILQKTLEDLGLKPQVLSSMARKVRVFGCHLQILHATVPPTWQLSCSETWTSGTTGQMQHRTHHLEHRMLGAGQKKPRWIAVPLTSILVKLYFHEQLLI